MSGNLLSSMFEFIFSWLPSGLWIPVWAVLAVAFFIIMIKILTTLVTIITKVIDLFIPG